MVIGNNGIGSCQTLSRRCPKSVRRRLTASESLWQPLGYLWDTSDSFRQLPTASDNLWTTDDNLWQPLDTLWTASGIWTASENHKFLKFYWKRILFYVSLQRNFDTWWDTCGILLGYFWIAFHWQGNSSWAKLGYLWDTSGIPVTASDSFRQLPKASDRIPLATSDSLWTTPGQPRSINF